MKILENVRENSAKKMFRLQNFNIIKVTEFMKLNH